MIEDDLKNVNDDLKKEIKLKYEDNLKMKVS